MATNPCSEDLYQQVCSQAERVCEQAVAEAKWAYNEALRKAVAKREKAIAEADGDVIKCNDALKRYNQAANAAWQARIKVVGKAEDDRTAAQTVALAALNQARQRA